MRTGWCFYKLSATNPCDERIPGVELPTPNNVSKYGTAVCNNTDVVFIKSPSFYKRAQERSFFFYRLLTRRNIRRGADSVVFFFFRSRYFHTNIHTALCVPKIPDEPCYSLNIVTVRCPWNRIGACYYNYTL